MPDIPHSDAIAAAAADFGWPELRLGQREAVASILDGHDVLAVMPTGHGKSAIEALAHPTTVALTATAAPPVRDEIVERLRMRDPRRVVRGFDRPNIFLEPHRVADDDQREAVVSRAAAEAKPGLVYVATRKQAERLADDLRAAGMRAEAYHAGMSRAERERVHDAFADREAEVVTATSAFGMGIDKADVRFVLHAAAPESPDSYYQEIGRADRTASPRSPPSTSGRRTSGSIASAPGDPPTPTCCRRPRRGSGARSSRCRRSGCASGSRWARAGSRPPSTCSSRPEPSRRTATGTSSGSRAR